MSASVHLGSVRDQAMIAWDYDADLAIFHAPNCDMEEVWHLASEWLKSLGYTTTKHGVKYRICPPDPLTWVPYKELYQETRESHSLGRNGLLKLVAQKWKRGERAKAPHGSNCIDIESYAITPGTNISIPGSKHTINCPAKKLFPTADGVLGPLKLRVPRTTDVLMDEYGRGCMQERVAKTFNGNGCVKCDHVVVPNGWRHSVWPNKALSRCSSDMWA